MLFTVTKETQERYNAFLQERSDIIKDCNIFLNDSCIKVGEAYQLGNTGDLAVIALVRHAVELLDGISILVAQGSILSCYPLLRSFFDAWLGVVHILEADSDNRGSAYFVSQLCKEKVFFERFDPTSKSGREIREELQNDIAGQTVLDNFPLQDVKNCLSELQSVLNDPMFKLATEAWKNNKKKEPEWYSLFDKPSNLRELAKSLCYLSGYELHYRPWCRQVHATATLKNLSSNEDSIIPRPIRNPEEIHEVVYSAGCLAITLGGKLIQKYDSEAGESTIKRYKELEQKINNLVSIRVPNSTVTDFPLRLY